MMQQTVLLTAIRGPDGLPKYGSVKMLVRWFRRCVLLSAMDGKVLENPRDPGGGSFTGPSVGVPTENWELAMKTHVDQYLRELDAVPHHFQMHFLHAVEILGYKHPMLQIRTWWRTLYERLVNDMHVHPETEQEMDERLGDRREGWLRRADKATLSLLIGVLLLLGWSAEVAARQVRPTSVAVRVAVPAWARYKTIDADGAVTVWDRKPFRLAPDFGGGEFWVSEGRGFRITGGLAPRHWRSSLRRVR